MILKNEQHFGVLWDSRKMFHRHTIRVSQEQERDCGTKILEEIMVYISPNLVLNINPQIKEAEQTKNSTNKERLPGHRIVKQLNTKNKEIF